MLRSAPSFVSSRVETARVPDSILVTAVRGIPSAVATFCWLMSRRSRGLTNTVGRLALVRSWCPPVLRINWAGEANLPSRPYTLRNSDIAVNIFPTRPITLDLPSTDMVGMLIRLCPMEKMMSQKIPQPGLDQRHRDADGEISRKHGNTQVADFAPDLWNRFAAGRRIRNEAEHAAGPIRRSVAAPVPETLTLNRDRTIADTRGNGCVFKVR